MKALVSCVVVLLIVNFSAFANDGVGNNGVSSARRAKVNYGSFEFELKTAFTSTTIVNNSGNGSQNGNAILRDVPAEYCIKSIQPVQIGSALHTGSVYVDPRNLGSIDISSLVAVNSSANGMSQYTIANLQSGNSGRSCNIIGVAEMAGSGEKFLVQNYVNINWEAPTASLRSAVALADFDEAINLLSFGLANVVHDSAQSISDKMTSSANEKIRRKNLNIEANYRSVGNDLMLLMCDIQALQLNANVCSGVNINAQKYLDQIKARYSTFIGGN